MIRATRKVHTSDPATWAFSALRKYQNVELTADRMARHRKIDLSRHRQNVRKQAQQIRHCLVQAREYFNAAQAVSLATKPNLLYYGTMSLALAEILYKQSGESSLDRARSQHRHHGLTMNAAQLPLQASIDQSAGALKAVPMIVDGERKGTFELWHRTSREHPLPGIVDEHVSPPTGRTNSFDVVYGAIDDPYPSVPERGLTLFEALANLPMITDQLAEVGVVSDFLRGVCRKEVWRGDQPHDQVHVIFHPHPRNLELFEKIKVHPGAVNRLHFTEVGKGWHIVIQNDPTETVSLALPPAVAIRADEWRMWSSMPPLNEFGYLYVALFIAGNYARYYPDRWLADVEASTPLSLAIEQLCTLAEWRCPWLTLCELDGTLLINDR